MEKTGRKVMSCVIDNNYFKKVAKKCQKESSATVEFNNLKIEEIEDESDLEVFEILLGVTDDDVFFYDGKETVISPDCDEKMFSSEHDGCIFAI